MFERPLAYRRSVARFAALAWLTIAQFAAVGLAADKDAPNKNNAPNKEIKVAGIVMERKDNWLTLKADGEDERVKYVAPQSEKRVTEALNHIFNAARVQLTYKQDGDTRQLVSIKRQIFKDTGTVTGNVVKVYDNFWVEVKPKTGVSDAYAPGLNYKDKAFMDKLLGLKPGDLVTIKFYTDFERHRIESLVIQKKADATSLEGTSLKTETPPKK